MKRSEWIGHSTARRKLTEDGWLYEDAEIQAFAIRGLMHGVDLPTLDAFIEQLEAEGAGAGAELRERRHKAWEGRSDEQIFFRHMEWIVLRRNEILGKKALLGEIKRLKIEAIAKPPPVLPITSLPLTHNIKNRTRQLDAEIEFAKTKAIVPDDPATVWTALSKLAEEKYGAMIGYSSDGIQYRGKKYQASEEPDIFTFKNLRDRMERDAKRGKTR